MTKDDGKDTSFRPTRPPAINETVRYTRAFRGLISAAKKLGKAVAPKPKLGWASKFQQRCVIRLSFSRNRPGPNGNAGLWAAHGTYISRSSATQAEKGVPVGFDQKRDDLSPRALLGDWQNAADPRLFKILISPEFGDRIDMKQLTRDVMAKVEEDMRKLNPKWNGLEWVAEIHYNTGNPHVHVALRGMSGGLAFRIPRGYVKEGIRRHAQDFCTRVMGYRTKQDAALAIERNEKQREAERVMNEQKQKTVTKRMAREGGQDRP